MTTTLRQMLSLEGRNALVTGGSRGLGLQIAEALGEMGARVAITARKLPELERAVTHLGTLGIAAEAFPGDLSRRDDVVPLAERVIERVGRVDILVNNAGVTWGAPATEHPVEAWDKVLQVNLSSVFVLSRHIAVKCMIPAGWGRIVNIASLAGLRGQDPRIMETVSYNASKAGLVNLTRALTAEWARHGITINAVCPGFFRTKMAETTIERNGDLIVDRTPAGRLGGDGDLKGIVALLASEAGAYITGQAIAVDGGMTAI